MTPLLPIANSEKEKAKRVSTALISEIEKGVRIGAPIGKWCLEVCKIFEIPVLPGENPSTIAKNKLIEWRMAVGYNMIPIEELAIARELEQILGNEVTGIKTAIASELKTRQERQNAAMFRQYKRRNNPAPPLYFSDDPYGD